MAKNTTIWIVIAVLALVAVGMFIQKSYPIFAISGNEVISRSVPSSIQAGQTFQVTYTAVGTSGTWGASIVDVVSGGCKFPDGTDTLKTVMLSTDGPTKTVTITAPTSQGSCTFNGDYKFGTESLKTFSTSTIQIKVCKTDADTNCDGILDRDELGVQITKWIAGTLDRNKLGEYIVAWL